MRRKSTSEFIKEALLVHGDIYDYSKVVYKNIQTKVTIICPKHGEFYPTPNNFIGKASTCPKCAGTAKKDTQVFIKAATKTHGNRYDYSKTKYNDAKTKVIITCKEHGDFEQRPKNHVRGQGCSKCSGNNRKNLLEFIHKALGVHGDRYDYNKVKYEGVKVQVIIKCPIHGEFKQTPDNHLSGRGCRKCVKKVSLPEVEISEFLRNQGYKVVMSRRDLIKPFELDIYLPDLKKAIEFNGLHWHYSDKLFVPGKHGNKSKLCKEKGIKLLHIREELWIKNKQKMKEVIIKFLEG